MSAEAWVWKLEPSSPILDSSPEWSLQENDAEASDRSLENDVSVALPSRADLAQQLLDDLEEYVKREETFSDWFEEKVPPLPLIFDDLQSVPGLATEPNIPVPAPDSNGGKKQDAFLKGEVNVTFALGHGQLTPPQSPPASESLLHTPLQNLYQQPTYVTLEPSGNLYSSECYLLVPQTPSPDPALALAREMAVVDEVVRGVAQQWEQLEYTDSSSRSSDGTEDSDDPEWQPVATPAAPVGRRARQSRPYNVPVPDRRQRKKEQNKNAATRYRQKKKTEIHTIVEEERILEDKNTELGTKVTDLEREIVYLKGLMREMFRAKGLIK